VATDPKAEPWPIFPELPVGYAAACLILAGLCSLTPLEDRSILAGAFLTLAAISAVVAAVTWARAR
jgi:hypothetical protein